MHQVRSKLLYLAVKLYRVTSYNSLSSPHQPTILHEVVTVPHGGAGSNFWEGWDTEKVKQTLHSLGQALSVPDGWGFQISRQSAHEGGKVSILHTGHLYPPGYIPGTYFCYRLSQPQGHSAAGRIKSMKNRNDTIENWTRNLLFLPECLNQLHHHIPLINSYRWR